MSTDSTELTFVRCPSCRSLVPAVSTRCRMCGASLSSGEEEKAPEKKTSRVRQRTMSKPQNELSVAAEKVRDETEENEEQEEPQEQPPVAAAADEIPQDETELSPDDPLSAFVEEVDEDFVEDDEGEFDDEDSYDDSEDFDEDDDVADVAEVDEPSVPQEAVSAAEPPAAEEEQVGPRVVVESGSQARGRKSGLSFRTPPAEEPPVEPPEEDPKASKAPPQRQEVSRDEQQPGAQPARKKPAAQEGAQPGRLFGWLVSYADKNGVATELREGKRFISSTKLKKNDLIIDDESVSTPHALMNIGGPKGLSLQDLMSERGTFVRRQGSANGYERIEEGTDVHHGDWVRFGDAEFLVSLVAHVGEK